MENIIKGQEVQYDAREQGVRTGRVTRRHIVEPYYQAGPNLIYYSITGNALLIPALDIISIIHP